MLSTWIMLSVAAAPPELERLVDEALATSPELSALEAEATGFRRGAEAAGAWRHPRLTVAYQNVPVDSWALGEEPMSMVQARVEQTLVLPGKTWRREAAARERVTAATWARRERENQLRARVTRAYWELALARQVRALTEEHIELVAQLEDAVRAKYEVGRANQHDLLRIEVWRGRLRDDLGDLDRRERELVATLNALAHRPLDGAIPTPDELSLPSAPAPIDELLQRARAARPALKQADASAAAMRASADLARYEAVPDPTVFAAYGVRKSLETGAAGRDLVTIGVSVPIPVFYGDRNGARAEQRAADARVVELRRAQLEDELTAELAAARAAWERANQQATTYRDELVPSARRAVESAMSAYQVDRTDFTSLFEAQVELLSFEKTIRRATVAALTAQASVAALVGDET